ncbi:uncharacterized protein LOC126602735 [Malus sylvestris]|uniref:uncharacterized protein LOC126602735 n=1 Tax=Malus sylvestris TaxID=3752 RepID=UPI0021ABE478|nr:uncharacterized protein LOC126602735 [Malus sylvestris]
MIEGPTPIGQCLQPHRVGVLESNRAVTGPIARESTRIGRENQLPESGDSYRKLPHAGFRNLKSKSDHVTEESDAEKARDWLTRFSERSLHARPKVETKLAPTQIAFGGAASTSMKVYGAPKGGNTDDAAASGMKVEKEYSWPWNQYSY